MLTCNIQKSTSIDSKQNTAEAAAPSWCLLSFKFADASRLECGPHVHCASATCWPRPRARAEVPGPRLGHTAPWPIPLSGQCLPRCPHRVPGNRLHQNPGAAGHQESARYEEVVVHPHYPWTGSVLSFLYLGHQPVKHDLQVPPLPPPPSPHHYQRCSVPCIYIYICTVLTSYLLGPHIYICMFVLCKHRTCKGLHTYIYIFCTALTLHLRGPIYYVRVCITLTSYLQEPSSPPPRRPLPPSTRYSAYVCTILSSCLHWSQMYRWTEYMWGPSMIQCFHHKLPLRPPCQTLEHRFDILPPATAISGYAIGVWKLEANCQFFIGAHMAISLQPHRQLQLRYQAMLLF